MYTIELSALDSELAANGYDTRTSTLSDLTSYVVGHGSTEVELLGAVTTDGNLYVPFNLVEAILYRSEAYADVTSAFEDAESIADLLESVRALLS